MSAHLHQQINLYQEQFRPRHVVLPARLLGVLFGVLVLGLATLHAQSRWSLRPVAAAVTQGRTDVAAGEARLVTLAAENPPRKPDPVLAREVKRRRAALAQTREIADNLERGAYGSVDGLSPFLVALARQHQEGTWLTRVDVARGGRALGLAGKTLLPEGVPAYLERLAGEEALAGKTFGSLELETVKDGLGEIAFNARTERGKRDDS